MPSLSVETNASIIWFDATKRWCTSKAPKGAFLNIIKGAELLHLEGGGNMLSDL